jgi:hypothetical protein
MPDKRRQKTDATNAELDKLAEIAPADIEDAKRAWRDDAPQPAKDLLDALPEKEKP